MNWDDLIAAARLAQGRAYAPYSDYPVGSAIQMDDGSIYSGCNVENRSYGLALCAERSALAAAISDGKRRPVAVVVATVSSPPAPPCGLCRQALIEFAEDLPILLVNEAGERRELRLAELLPEPFKLPERE